MGQGYSLLSSSTGPLPGYAPRAPDPVVTDNSAVFRLQYSRLPTAAHSTGSASAVNSATGGGGAASVYSSAAVRAAPSSGGNIYQYPHHPPLELNPPRSPQYHAPSGERNNRQLTSSAITATSAAAAAFESFPTSLLDGTSTWNATGFGELCEMLERKSSSLYASPDQLSAKPSLAKNDGHLQTGNGQKNAAAAHPEVAADAGVSVLRHQSLRQLISSVVNTAPPPPAVGMLPLTTNSSATVSTPASSTTVQRSTSGISSSSSQNTVVPTLERQYSTVRQRRHTADTVAPASVVSDDAVVANHPVSGSHNPTRRPSDVKVQDGVRRQLREDTSHSLMNEPAQAKPPLAQPRTSQLTENLKSNLERLLQRNAGPNHQHGLLANKHLEETSARLQRAIRSTGLKTNKLHERPSGHHNPTNNLSSPDGALDDVNRDHHRDVNTSIHDINDSSAVAQDTAEITGGGGSSTDFAKPIVRSTSVYSTTGSVSLAFSGGDACSNNVAKPVAMVQPRKVHGVRVLPAAAVQLSGSALRATRVSRSPAIRHVRPYRQQQQREHNLTASISSSSTVSSRVAAKKHGAQQQQPPPASIKRWKPVDGQVSKDRKRMSSSDVIKSSDEDGNDDNWQCRRLQSGCQSSASGKSIGRSGSRSANSSCSSRRSRSRLHSSRRIDIWSNSGTTQHEALLVGQKKDAEIAALLQHIRLEGKAKTKAKSTASRRSRERMINATVCSVTSDLEQSLGYFP